MAQAEGTIIQKHATAATIGLFGISGITGLMLFLEVGQGIVKPIHEWLSVLFVVAAVLHVVRNKLAFVKLMKLRRTLAVCGAALAVASFMMVGEAAQEGSGGGANPVRAMINLMVDAPLADVATLLREPAEVVVARLQGSGATAAHPSKSLNEIAAESGVDTRQLLAVALDGGAAKRR